MAAKSKTPAQIERNLRHIHDKALTADVAVDQHNRELVHGPRGPPVEAGLSGRIERLKITAARIGVGTTKFYEDFVDKGGSDPFVPGTGNTVVRLRPVSLGKRAIGFFSDEVDDLIEGLRAFRDALPRTPPPRPVPAEFHPSRHRKAQKQSGRLMPTAR